jgi:hypothetical protein
MKSIGHAASLNQFILPPTSFRVLSPEGRLFINSVTTCRCFLPSDPY